MSSEKSNEPAVLDVHLWRGAGSEGQYETFHVPMQENQTVLDIVSYVQQHLDASLTYRFACRVGMCGSCAMMVNGEPRWTCRTHVKKVASTEGKLTISPLRNLPVIKDLVVDMDRFFDKWIKAEAVHHPTRTSAQAIEAVSEETSARQAANEAIECINCAVCYAACDVVASNPDYLGPAALNRAWSLVNDVRDGGRDAILEAVSAGGGCHNCHSHQSCQKYCPNELNPTASIAGLKRESAKYAVRKFFTSPETEPEKAR
jgi:fumarate reductase iron-sulfur subunit